ncbi:MAG: hypothetical protein IJ977_00825, partial [Fibrobacter sp.]|nr:hypothetical protein [Fibrobacter sp.]
VADALINAAVQHEADDKGKGPQGNEPHDVPTEKVFTSLADAFPEGQKVCTTMFKLAAIYSTEGNIDMQKQYLQKILNSKTCSTSGEFEQAAEILQEILEQETQTGPKAAEPSNGPEAAAPIAETPAADAQPAAPAPAP